MKKTVLLFCSLLICFSCDSQKKQKILFSYKGILDKEYRFNLGKVIPLTNEQALEIDGDISLDGLFFYYTSNRARENYDIYLRDLNNITTVRLTNHPAKDYSPAISPNGKRLVFVSNREDPAGDIFLLPLKAKSIIQEYETKISPDLNLDEKAKNLTKAYDPRTKTIQSIKEAHPTWSPDNRLIAFSSTKNGLENIWLLDPQQEKKEQLTILGGVYPQFSPDGQKIIFISYRNPHNKGDIYLIDLKTKNEKQLTNGPQIELYPSFGANNNEIIYTQINQDTNQDKVINLKDDSQIYFQNLKENLSYPLTLAVPSSFAAKWLPVYNIKGHKGVIVYANQKKENINLNIIPGSGIIPKKNNAKLQYNLARRYLDEYDDQMKYLLALERVYYYFYNQKNTFAKIYISKALLEATQYYQRKKNLKKSRELLKIFENWSRQDLYAQTVYKHLKLISQKKSGLLAFQNALEKISLQKNKEYKPYLLEDLADEYLKIKKNNKAKQIYTNLIKKYPKHKRIYYLHQKLASLDKTQQISPHYFPILKSAPLPLKVKAKKGLLARFTNPTKVKNNLKKLKSLISKHQGEKNIFYLLQYALGLNLFYNKDFKSAQKILKEVIQKKDKNDLIYYKANILLGDLLWHRKKEATTEKHYYTAVNKYKLVWKEKSFSDKIDWLLNYYDEKGYQARENKNFKKASYLYEKYTSLASYLKRRKKFKLIYDHFGPKAHVQYIDTFLAWQGEDKIDDLIGKYLKGLPRARLDFDKAYLYGFGYLYTQKGLLKQKKSTSEFIKNFNLALEQIDWAIFLDDTFVEPYLLKSWIYQYLDLQRSSAKEDLKKMINKNFPKYLWEENSDLLEKILASNNENFHKENEGNIHLNLANNYFLLLNYSRALYHYQQVYKYKEKFGSPVEEALFHFHFGYCSWQENSLETAKIEMEKALGIYQFLANHEKNKKNNLYQRPIHSIYKYFALFSRITQNYEEALQWYQKIISSAKEYNLSLDQTRYQQEMAFCLKEMGELELALSLLEETFTVLERKASSEPKFNLKLDLVNWVSLPIFDLGIDKTVIGDSKLIKPLNNRQKKLLNLSWQQEIFSDQQKIDQTSQFLHKKIELLKHKNNETDKKNLIITLNNLGYYYFKQNKYFEAEKYFLKAYKSISDKDEETFAKLKPILNNLTNLYLFLSTRTNFSEANSLVDKNSVLSEQKIIDLISPLEKIKENFPNNFQLNLILGKLKFIQASLLRQNRFKNSAHYKQDGFDIYQNYQTKYRLYNESLKFLNKSLALLKQAQKAIPGSKAEIMLLAALSYTETGRLKKAYESFLKVIELATKNNDTDLLLNSYEKINLFLDNYASQLIKENSALNKSITKLKKESTRKRIKLLMQKGELEKSTKIYQELNLGEKKSFKLKERTIFNLLELNLNLKRLIIGKNLTQLEGSFLKKIIKVSLAPKSPQAINILLDKVLNFYIQTNNQAKIILISEIKKYLLSRSKFNSPPNHTNNKIFAKKLAEFSLKGARDKLPSESLIIYLTKKKNDLLLLTIDKKESKTFIIKSGYSNLKQIINDYKKRAFKLEEIEIISEKLANIFKPLKKTYFSKKILLFIPDQFTEEIPFEIIKDKNSFLEENHLIAYLSSLVLVPEIKLNQQKLKRIKYIGPDKSALNLNKMALEETGLKIVQNSQQLDAIHFDSALNYNKQKKELYLAKKPYKKYLDWKNRVALYLPLNKINNLTYRDILFYQNLFQAKTKYLITNKAKKDKLSEAIFLENFYKQINFNKNLLESFSRAKKMIYKNKQFVHPIYWTRLRLHYN